MRKTINFNGFDFEYIGLSQIGDGKIENQDSFDMYCDDNILIIVVADGLGSAPFSKEGSKNICSIAIDYFKTNYSCINCYDIQQQWKEIIKSNYDLYDTTLKFTILTKELVICGGVGDGWILVKGKDFLENLEMDHTFSNQTDTILSIGLRDKFIIKEYPFENINTILMATDGFSEDIDKETSSDFISSIENSMIDDVDMFYDDLSETLKNWPIKSNKDDKTVVIVRRMV